MSDRHDHELNRFWNEIAERGSSAGRDLDAEDITLVRRLQSLAAAPLPGSAGERVWRSLAETWEVDPATSREHAAPIRINDSRRVRQVQVPSPAPPSWLRRPILRYVAAAVLILGVVLAIDILRDPGSDYGGAPVINAPATPSPAASPTTLFEITLPADLVPHTTGRISGLSYDKYRAGSQSTWSPYCCDGPVVQYQLTGSIQVTGSAELQIVRADGTTERIPANTEATVNTGDTLVTLNQTEITTVNSGATDAEILGWLLLDSPGDRFGGRTGQDGLVGGTHVVVSDFQGTMVDLPGAVTVTLQKLEVEPNEVVHPPAGGVQLMLTLNNFYELVATVGADSSFTAHNTNGQPTTPVYVVTVRPADSSGPPGSSTPEP